MTDSAGASNNLEFEEVEIPPLLASSYLFYKPPRLSRKFRVVDPEVTKLMNNIILKYRARGSDLEAILRAAYEKDPEKYTKLGPDDDLSWLGFKNSVQRERVFPVSEAKKLILPMSYKDFKQLIPQKIRTRGIDNGHSSFDFSYDKAEEMGIARITTANPLRANIIIKVFNALEYAAFCPHTKMSRINIHRFNGGSVFAARFLCHKSDCPIKVEVRTVDVVEHDEFKRLIEGAEDVDPNKKLFTVVASSIGGRHDHRRFFYQEGMPSGSLPSDIHVDDLEYTTNMKLINLDNGEPIVDDEPFEEQDGIMSDTYRNYYTRRSRARKAVRPKDVPPSNYNPLNHTDNLTVLENEAPREARKRTPEISGEKLWKTVEKARLVPEVSHFIEIELIRQINELRKGLDNVRQLQSCTRAGSYSRNFIVDLIPRCGLAESVKSHLEELKKENEKQLEIEAQELAFCHQKMKKMEEDLRVKRQRTRGLEDNI